MTQAQKKPKRDAKGRLLPGPSLNPKGRPTRQKETEYLAAIYSVISLSRMASMSEGIADIVEARDDEGEFRYQPADRIKAYKVLCDQIVPKPADIIDDDDKPAPSAIRIVTIDGRSVDAIKPDGTDKARE